MHVGRSVDIVLRLGVAFALLYPALNAVFDPYAWVGYFPTFMRGFVPDLVLLHLFGIVEVVLAHWILSGRRVFYPALITVGLLVLIILLNLGDFQVVFRDLSIALMALSLVALHRPGTHHHSV